MTLAIDVQYSNALNIYVRNFKVKTNTPYMANFSCPLCGDSHKSKKKARGYIYFKKGRMSFYCHNCGVSTSFAKFLKSFNRTLYNQYKLEVFRHEKVERTDKVDMSVFKRETTPFPVSEMDSLFDRCDRLPSDHGAILYLKKRMIPENKYRQLYYVDKLKDFYSKKVDDDVPRIVLPMYNRNKELSGISCRSITEEGLRYLKIKINDHDDMVFGLNNIDLKKTIYVTEGEMDSLFLDNAIAMGNSALHITRNILPPSVDVVLIYDNEPRNVEICKQIQRGIEHYPVVMWPKTLVKKDINEMICDGMTQKELLDIIDENTYSGLSAKMVFSNWRKC